MFRKLMPVLLVFTLLFGFTTSASAAQHWYHEPSGDEWRAYQVYDVYSVVDLESCYIPPGANQGLKKLGYYINTVTEWQYYQYYFLWDDVLNKVVGTKYLSTSQYKTTSTGPILYRTEWVTCYR